MEKVLIVNIIALVVAAVFCTTCLIGWFKAEKKLAKHGESTLFRNDKK